MSNVIVERKIIMKSLSEIKPYERNPRKNDRTVELLCEMIPRVGFNVPLVIDANNVIVKGHARYLAAQKLGMREVPCIVTHADAESIKADRIADNKVSEFSEWVNEALMHEVDMLDVDFDLSSMGLPKVTYDDIPSIEDFEFASEDASTDSDDEENERPISEEEKQRIYAEFLERQARENAVEVQMATKGEIEAALYKQAHMPKEAREYKKCICKKCGNVMYFDKNVLYNKNGTIRRR